MAETQRWVNRPDGSNWGDFGKDDQLGRFNLIDPAARLRGAAQVREGLAFCLSLPLDYPGGNALLGHRDEPRYHYAPRGEGHNFNFDMGSIIPCACDIVSDEAVTLDMQYSTHWDALGHIGCAFDADGDGHDEVVYYNGYRAGEHLVGPSDPNPVKGAHALGISNMAETAVQTRGVLIDLHRIWGFERVHVGYDELMPLIEKLDVEITKGDILCFYTGFADRLLGMRKKPDAGVLAKTSPGLDGRCPKLLNWITDSGVAGLCADNFTVETYPARPSDAPLHPVMPLHQHCLFKLGIPLGELWYLAKLADWLHAAGRSSFLLTAPPLRLARAVGSPLTPVATV